jgi:hypothetical protein
VLAGDTISGSVFASGRVTYSFISPSGAEYAVFFEATAGGGTIFVKDSTTDVDEFTSTGTPGEQLALSSRLTTLSSLDSAIIVEVIDPATGASLVGGNVAIFGSNTFFTVGGFTVPASGTFIVQAHVFGEQGYGVGTTSYEFLVTRGP